MSKSVKITLGGVEYTVSMLNIGQLRRVTKLLASAQADTGYDVLAIGLERAEPPVQDFDAIEADIEEIGPAVTALLALSGLKPDKPVGEAQPAGANAG